MSRDPEYLRECQALARCVERFRTLSALRSSPEWPGIERRLSDVLGRVHRHEPARAAPPPEHSDRVRAVHWNIEHGNEYGLVERALCRHPELRDADLYLFNEIDLGMARAGNRDVTGDLAAALGLHGVWAPLFLETTVGRDDDARSANGRPNEESLFGLAILSRWPIGEVRVRELPSPEAYQFDLERIVGRHIALIAEIRRPEGAFVAVSAHLEVHRTRAHRAAQMRVIVETLADERRPVLLAGDFNSHTFERGRPQDVVSAAAALMFAPERALVHRLQFPDHGPDREPLFDELRRGGFEWKRLGDHAPTLQLRFDRVDELRAFPRFVQRAVSRILSWAERRGRLRLDWFAGRGWNAGRGFTVAGLNGPGRASDHAPIVAELW